MSDSVYVATGTLTLAAAAHVPGSIFSLSEEEAAIYAEVIRPADENEIAIFEATQEVDEPVKKAEPVKVLTAAEKKAAKKAEEAAAAEAAKAAEEAAAAEAAKAAGETLV